MKILILGATGNIGKEAVKALIKKGIRPVAGVRDTDKARSLLGDEIDYVPFDFDDPATFLPALTGIDRLYFISPPNDPVPAVQQLIQKAKEAGVRHLLYSSGRTTGDVPGKPLNQVENLVRASRISFTIIRPGWFMQNFTSWLGAWIVPEGKIYVPAGDSRTAFIDVRDIGEVVAEILTGEGYEGKTYGLTSDEAIDHHEVARLIGKAVGRKVEYISPESEAYIDLMVEKGWSRKQATYVDGLYKWVREGKEEDPSPDVAGILGRPPRRFSQFAADYRETWKLGDLGNWGL